ncbi:hypothetical protein K503DRAFT_613269 [Rhizopogon vinicolor AM-OR11-026]|uniref:Uncharacterized protein n=1 Tax=Rhizopogon vinicolor AM-OR11-026 TaxID=1314800 RepID=A0A1B7NGC5_9AGAM|nr:hypothetical protein K503DRAFT_613269 [Rhizopogon vinicolor AM-OR11-026]
MPKSGDTGDVFGTECQPDRRGVPMVGDRGGLWYPSAGYAMGEVELPTRNDGLLYMTVNRENVTNKKKGSYHGIVYITS